jgi:hypothetical protein
MTSPAAVRHGRGDQLPHSATTSHGPRRTAARCEWRAADITQDCRGFRQPPMASRLTSTRLSCLPASPKRPASTVQTYYCTVPCPHNHPSPASAHTILPTAHQIAPKSTRYRPTDCGSCCPCAHHQPLLLTVVADPSLCAIRFVELASQEYTRSPNGTLRRRRWPATFAAMVFLLCPCDQSAPVGTTTMHCASLPHTEHSFSSALPALALHPLRQRP